MTHVRRVRYSVVMTAISVILSCVFAVYWVGTQNQKWCTLLDALHQPATPVTSDAGPNVRAQYERTVRIQNEIGKIRSEFC